MFHDIARHGIVSWGDARAIGIRPAQWRAAHLTGQLIALHPKVSRLADVPETPGAFEPRALAAVWSAGDGALASHRTASRLWGAPIPAPAPVDLLIPHHRRVRPRTDVRIHRTIDRLDLEPSSRSGVPCTNAVRTLVDLGAVAPEAVAPTLTDFVVRRLVPISAARSVLERHAGRGRLGPRALRSALQDWPLGTAVPDSALEVELARLLRDHRLGRWEFHARIEGFEVDFAHRAAQVVIEGDGYEFHSDRNAFETDRRRDATLAAAGWLVVRVTWRQVVDDPGAIADRLRQIVRARAT